MADANEYYSGGAWGTVTTYDYVYEATGTNDNTAICNLVNNFLDATGTWSGTTYLNLNLKITGNLGITTPVYINGTNSCAYFYFSSSQTRGARVHIDWSDARGINLTGAGYSYCMIVKYAGVGCTTHNFGLSASIISSTAHTRGINIETGTTCDIYFSNCYIKTTNSYSGGNSIGFENWGANTHVTNCYFEVKSTATGNGDAYGIASQTTTSRLFVNNCFVFTYGANAGQSDGIICSGEIYANNCYIDSESPSANCAKGFYTTGEEAKGFLTNSYIWSGGYGILCAGSSYMYVINCSSTAGTSAAADCNANGHLYMTNTYTNGVYGVLGEGDYTIYATNCVCMAYSSQYNVYGAYSAGTGPIYLTGCYCYGNAAAASTANMYSGGIINGSSGSVYANGCYITCRTATTGGGSAFSVWNTGTGNVFINNCYVTGSSTTASVTLVGVFNSNTGIAGMNNCFISVTGYSSSMSVLSGSTGTCLVNNCYIYSNSTGDGISRGVRATDTSITIVSGSYVYSYSTIASQEVSAIINEGYGTMTVSNCYVYSQSTTTTSYGIYSINANRTRISNTTVYNYAYSYANGICCRNSGVMSISGCYVYAEAAVYEAYGILNASSCLMNVTNTYATAKSTTTTVTSAGNAYAIYNSGSKITIRNCYCLGYRHNTNTAGIGVGIYNGGGSGDSVCCITITGCYLPVLTITNYTQSWLIYLGNATYYPKFYISGNTFGTSSALNVKGSQTSYLAAAANQWFPRYGNIFLA